MNVLKLIRTALLAVFAASTAIPTTAVAQRDGVYRNPTIGGQLLDGCYRWPGPCNSRRQADAFCDEEGYDGAYDYETENRVGVMTTKRLGDGGTCFASCTVMTYVECE